MYFNFFHDYLFAHPLFLTQPFWATAFTAWLKTPAIKALYAHAAVSVTVKQNQIFIRLDKNRISLSVTFAMVCCPLSPVADAVILSHRVFTACPHTSAMKASYSHAAVNQSPGSRTKLQSSWKIATLGLFFLMVFAFCLSPVAHVVTLSHHSWSSRLNTSATSQYASEKKSRIRTLRLSGHYSKVEPNSFALKNLQLWGLFFQHFPWSTAFRLSSVAHAVILSRHFFHVWVTAFMLRVSIRQRGKQSKYIHACCGYQSL